MIHLHRISLQQARISGHNVTQAHADDIAWHEFTRRGGDPFPIPFHPGLDRKLGFEGGDGIARLALLPESDHGVGQQQEKNDGEVRPVPDHARQDDRNLDHPRDGPPKIAEEFYEGIGLLFFNLVGPILGQTFLRFGLTESLRRRPQFPLHLGQRQRLQVWLRIRSRPRRHGLDGIRLHVRTLAGPWHTPSFAG